MAQPPAPTPTVGINPFPAPPGTPLAPPAPMTGTSASAAAGASFTAQPYTSSATRGLDPLSSHLTNQAAANSAPTHSSSGRVGSVDAHRIAFAASGVPEIDPLLIHIAGRGAPPGGAGGRAAPANGDAARPAPVEELHLTLAEQFQQLSETLNSADEDAGTGESGLAAFGSPQIQQEARLESEDGDSGPDRLQAMVQEMTADEGLGEGAWNEAGAELGEGEEIKLSTKEKRRREYVDELEAATYIADRRKRHSRFNNNVASILRM
ncbi:hypothetical protein JCM5296_000409, partial [Sporobolomyces johnsonii]